LRVAACYSNTRQTAAVPHSVVGVAGRSVLQLLLLLLLLLLLQLLLLPLLLQGGRC
jgi:hypothetical protein